MTDQEIYALNRRVAEALGYKFLRTTDSFIDISWWEVTRPDGSQVEIYDETPFTPRYDIGLHNWAGDTDAALSLALSDDILGVDVNVAGGEVVALVRSTAHGGTGYGDTYAIAICRAWLAWKEAK